MAIANYEANKKQEEDDPPQDLNLRRKQFMTVARSALNFDLYLNNIHSGKTDADLARMGQLRDDDFVDEISDEIDEMDTGGKRKKRRDRDRGGSRRKRSASASRKRHKKLKARQEDTSESDPSSSSDSRDESSEPDFKAPRKRRRNS